jgi:hypothetical protein
VREAILFHFRRQWVVASWGSEGASQKRRECEAGFAMLVCGAEMLLSGAIL